VIARISLATLVLVASTGLALGQDKPTLRKACAADAQKLCSDAGSGGHGMFRCLRKHQSDLSPDCQSALAAAIAKHRTQQSGSSSGQ
jgi:Cysteine rich repeat